MIEQDTILKVQAYVDNELTQADAREVVALVERDPQARALCTELKELRTLVSANEIQVKLPESREFFWSKIEREIVRSSTIAASPGRSRWWMRILACGWFCHARHDGDSRAQARLGPGPVEPLA